MNIWDIWGDKRCKSLGASVYRDSLGACKETCEKTESCNAFVVIEANLEIICDLRDCSVSAPALVVPDDEMKGYYLATGKKQIDI